MAASIKKSSTNDQLAPNDEIERYASVSLMHDHLVSCRSPADDPRREVYGWSVSTKASGESAENVNNIPVPIHCRPIFNTHEQTQVQFTNIFSIHRYFLFFSRSGVQWVLI